MHRAAVEAPLVATKLFVPRLRPNRVDRIRLREQLERSRQVVLVSAPAGSGKSTLLADWAAGSGERVAWVSLEPPDDQPRRFINYVLAALRKAEAIAWSETLDSARAASPEMYEAVLIELLNSVADGPRPVTLILDDYHAIESDSVHAVLQFLIDHLPPNLRIVIATRADPPLPLSRLRARDMLAEVRAADLRFSLDEVEQFLNGAMDLALPKGEIAELERRTEGWAVGLQMAAISLRAHSEKARFIAGFTGSNRYILDYLTDEVVAGQPQEVRDFLLKTSILDRLSAPLFNAVTGRNDAESILMWLDASNLFLISLDDRRSWYRYHHLFGTLLQHQLERSFDAAAIAALHQKASDWYAANGSADAAMHHARAAKDLDRIRAILSAHGLDRLLKAEAGSVQEWLSLVPAEDLQNRVDFLVFQAIIGILALRLQDTATMIGRAEELVDGNTPVELRACVLTVRGTTLRAAQRVEEAVRYFHRALELLQPGARWLGIVSLELGLAELMVGNLVQAEQALTRLRTGARPARTIHAVMGHSTLAQSRLLRGDPDDALALAHEVIGWIEEWDREDHSGIALAAFPHAVLSEVHRYRNDLDAARAFADRGIELGKRGFHIGFFESSKSRARIAAAENDWDTAMRIGAQLQQAVSATSHNVWKQVIEWLVNANLFRRGQRTGNQADLDFVARAVEEAGLLEPPYQVRERRLPAFHTSDAFLVAARVLIQQGRNREALEMLEEILQFSWERDCGAVVIETLILRSLAQEGEKAVTTMQEALELASRPRFARLFVEEGEAVIPLLERAAPRISDQSFAAMLSFQPRPAAVVPADNTLSQRELEVLRLVSSGVSNQEAGRKLFISPGTVKKHLDNIYAKLAVGGRVQAIARARELRLI